MRARTTAVGAMHGRGHDKAGCRIVVGRGGATARIGTVGHGWWLRELFVKGAGHLKGGEYRGLREETKAMRKGHICHTCGEALLSPAVISQNGITKGTVSCAAFRTGTQSRRGHESERTSKEDVQAEPPGHSEQWRQAEFGVQTRTSDLLAVGTGGHRSGASCMTGAKTMTHG